MQILLFPPSYTNLRGDDFIISISSLSDLYSWVITWVSVQNIHCPPFLFITMTTRKEVLNKGEAKTCQIEEMTILLYKVIVCTVIINAYICITACIVQRSCSENY